MPLLNTKRTALFLAPGAIVPTPPTGFLETSEPVIIVPEFTSIDINRITGQLNSKTQVTDVCRTKTAFTVPHVMRASDTAAIALNTPPEYGLLLKCAGFIETIDTVTGGQETVTYTNGTDAIGQVSALGYLDGQKFTFTESLSCGVDFNLTVGEPAMLTGALEGYMDSAVPVAEANPTVALTAEPALIVSCADIVTYDGACLPLESVSINMNPEFRDIYTLGGACGIKSNFVADYALEIVAVFYVDSDVYGREASAIESGLFKEIVIKLGLDETSTEVNGKSVVFTAPLAKATIYTDDENNDLLQRTVTYRIMDGATVAALSIKNGFFA